MAIARVLAVGVVLVAASLVGNPSTGGASVASHGSPVPGYWLVGADGGVFAFNAPFEGSGAPAGGSPGVCPFAFGPTINVSAASLAGSGQVISSSDCVGIAGSEAGSGYWVANNTSLPSAFGSAVGQSAAPASTGQPSGGAPSRPRPAAVGSPR